METAKKIILSVVFLIIFAGILSGTTIMDNTQMDSSQIKEELLTISSIAEEGSVLSQQFVDGKNTQTYVKMQSTLLSKHVEDVYGDINSQQFDVKQAGVLKDTLELNTQLLITMHMLGSSTNDKKAIASIKKDLEKVVKKSEEISNKL
jgi:hypothetical protein